VKKKVHPHVWKTAGLYSHTCGTKQVHTTTREAVVQLEKTGCTCEGLNRAAHVNFLGK
jgi:hypothetical protein